MISITGIMAFGEELKDGDRKHYYNIVFKDHILWIFYIISFYMFLNIAAFPVLTIVTRMNLMKCFVPDFII